MDDEVAQGMAEHASDSLALIESSTMHRANDRNLFYMFQDIITNLI